MQIRLTVLGPRSGRAARGCDVLITAPAGTTLGTVAGALASAAGSAQPGGRSTGTSVVLYAGAGRLAHTAVLGAPPLVDGALISLHAPAEQPGDHGQYGRFGQYGRPPADLATLHVVGGPDAGGVHLLQGGQARIGRSADADVPLDDPDVSRLHCSVAVGPDGEITVTDLGSTNGTALSGHPVGPQPLPFPPAALLRIGESTLRLDPAHPPTPPLATTADTDGHLHVSIRAADDPQEAPAGDGWSYTHGSGADSGAADPHDAGRYEDAAGGPSRDPYRPDSEAQTYGRGFDAEGQGRRATGERARRGPGEPAARSGIAGAIGAWARRLASGRGPVGAVPDEGDGGEADALRERWPDPAAVLLTALGPGRRLWERGPGHPDALTVRLGTADLPSQDGNRLLTGVPYTVDLRSPRTPALTLAGPRPRLSGLARAILAQLCALHSPATLEVVLLSADRTRGADQRTEEWSWLNWLPHLRPAHGQDCRLLLAFDRDQAEARASELVRRLESGALGASWAGASSEAVTAAAASYDGPFTLLVIDGDPGSPTLRDALARIAAAGPSAGIHTLALTEPGERPVLTHGLTARLAGDVATTLRVELLTSSGASSASASPAGPSGAPSPAPGPSGGPDTAGQPGGAAVAGPGRPGSGAAAAGQEPRADRFGDTARVVRPDGPGGARRPSEAGGDIVLDAVSSTWAEHFARALAPLREADSTTADIPSRHALPGTVRLLDELDLALATPARIAARWGDAPGAVAGAAAVIGAGAGGRVAVDLVAEGPHAMVGGAPGSGKTELLRSLAAALAAGERPDRLALVLVDGAGLERGEGLASCAELPHVSTHLVASDPVRMREFAQALTAELKRRAEVLAGQDFAAWHARRMVSAKVPHQGGRKGAPLGYEPGPVLPRLVLVVDDFDALVAPGLGSPGRPAAGSVVRALEAVARDGEPLGVHLFASTGRPERTAGTDADERARLRIALRMPDPESAALLVHVEDPAGLDDTVPGRGYLRRPGGAVTVFQAARVSARIPRTATLRPTVVPLEWERMGDPPARRQVRELGNGPTDLALLASALQRAAETAPEDPGAEGATSRGANPGAPARPQI
jgi:FtsK/SpoIIIE family/Inner membrane component of T3SS, cytoplasmic domain